MRATIETQSVRLAIDTFDTQLVENAQAYLAKNEHLIKQLTQEVSENQNSETNLIFLLLIIVMVLSYFGTKKKVTYESADADKLLKASSYLGLFIPYTLILTGLANAAGADISLNTTELLIGSVSILSLVFGVMSMPTKDSEPLL